MSNEAAPSAPTSPISTQEHDGSDSAAEFSPEVMAKLAGTETDTKEPVAEKKQDFLAPKFAALTRKAKEIKAQEQSIKNREAELSKRIAELEGRSKESDTKIKSFEQSFKENPLKALKERGITMEQLIEMQMNDENPTVDMKLKRMQEEMESKALSRVEELEKRLQAKEEEEANAKYNQAVDGYKSELGKFVTQNADAYELIAANGATDLMFEVAENYYKETKKVPDIKEVADAVEAHLEEEARKIFELKKFKQASQQKTQTSKTAPTLSNTAAANVPSNGSKKLTAEESLREAAKLIRWDDGI
jgi:hypothetical protein